MTKYLLVLYICTGICIAGSSYKDGVLMGPGIDPPSYAQVFLVVDSFPAGASGYSMGLAFDGQYLWNNEAFVHWFARMDTATGSVINPFNTTIGNRDMTFDGQYLWVSDWQTSSISQFDTSNCSVINTFYPPFYAGKPNGMAWDGTQLWVGEESGRIYQMTTGGDTIRSIPPPVFYSYDPRGLAFDGDYLWVGYQSSGLIYKVDTAGGAVLETHNAPGVVSGQRFQQGLTFDGQYLWSTVGGAVQMIYKIDIGIVSIEEHEQKIEQKSGISLASNPFTRRAEITLTIHRPTEARLSIVDVAGRTVSILSDGSLVPGDYSYTWHCTGSQSGIYFAVLKTKSAVETRKLIKARD